MEVEEEQVFGQGEAEEKEPGELRAMRWEDRELERRPLVVVVVVGVEGVVVAVLTDGAEKRFSVVIGWFNIRPSSSKLEGKSRFSNEL